MPNLRADSASAAAYNAGATRLWVPPMPLTDAIARFSDHHVSQRDRERDHPLGRRDAVVRDDSVIALRPVEPVLRPSHEAWTAASPMRAVDRAFVATRPREPQSAASRGEPRRNALEPSNRDRTSRCEAHQLKRLKLAGRQDPLDGAAIHAPEPSTQPSVRALRRQDGRRGNRP